MQRFLTPTGVAGLDGIKPGVFYTLRNGQPVEA